MEAYKILREINGVMSHTQIQRVIDRADAVLRDVPAMKQRLAEIKAYLAK